MELPVVGRRAVGILLSVCLVVPVVGDPPPASAASLPAGFQETTVISGLSAPTVVRFSSDGRVFVAEKSGIIRVFDSLSDTSPTVFADLRTNVHNFWDRGLLGMALAPGFPADPYVYVLYSYDHILNDSAPAPRWGDTCPTPPGATGDGCVISGRLSRLQADGNTMSGSEQVLIEDWCQQYPSHSIGSLAFGADGALYVSAGDGASFNWADYGQDGSPVNPCGDPPAGVGGTQTSPTAEGGALRSQDVRTTSDPTGLNGTVLRVDPTTGAGMTGNPFATSPDQNARRIVGYGYRNPFRIAIRPGTNEVWTGDVGWSSWEELNRLVTPADATADNFGWPCYEGTGRQGSYDALNLDLCETLYTAGASAVVAPYYTYRHSDSIVSGEACNNGQGSSTVGMAFYSGGAYPATYDGALFFADYSRDCLWVMTAGTNGLPDPTSRANFVTPAANPVHLEIGPAGDLFYVDFSGGTIRRIRYFVANQPPTASFTASPASGPAPLAVTFDGSGSSDPDSDPLTYAWDLDGDGSFDDAWTETASRTYPSDGNVSVRLQVTDPSGATHVSAAKTITVGNDPPTAVIDTATTPWVVDQTIAFSGHATDPDEGTLAASQLSWDVVLMHCPQQCHEHPLQTIPGVASGSFAAPDHEYPAHLELRLTATDSLGLSDTAVVELDPVTVDLSFVTSPVGLDLTVGGATEAAPFTRRVIVGSANSLSADSPQTVGGVSYDWTGWSDSGAQSHDITASAVAGTYTATYAAPTLSSIAVTPVNPSIAAGADQQFTATATYSDATTANITSVATWTSTNASATISSTGLAHGVSAGSSTISATVGAVSGSTGLTVTAVSAYTLSGTVTAGGSGLDDAWVYAFDNDTSAYASSTA
ncbi:MAG TPA: PQQ-dependent sugar dehydrogenase, partial [Actinomycetes bacterium]|nr:PQQ-dependent sugar dehydrogenase [Actinomycetes bacterium]